MAPEVRGPAVIGRVAKSGIGLNSRLGSRLVHGQTSPPEHGPCGRPMSDARIIARASRPRAYSHQPRGSRPSRPQEPRPVTGMGRSQRARGFRQCGTFLARMPQHEEEQPCGPASAVALSALSIALAACGGAAATAAPTAAPTATPTVATAAPTAAPAVAPPRPPPPAPTAAPPQSDLKIGVVTDIGTLNDKDYNEYSFKGAEAGAAAIGAAAPAVDRPEGRVRVRGRHPGVRRPEVQHHRDGRLQPDGATPSRPPRPTRPSSSSASTSRRSA